MKFIDVPYQDSADTKVRMIRLDIHTILAPLVGLLSIPGTPRLPRAPEETMAILDRLYDVPRETQVHPRCGWPHDFCKAPREKVVHVMTNAAGKIIGFLCDDHRKLYDPSLQLDDPKPRSGASMMLPPTVPGTPR